MPGTGGQLTPTNKHLCPCGDDILGEDTVRLMIGLMRHFQIEVCAGKAVKIGGLTEPGLQTLSVKIINISGFVGHKDSSCKYQTVML